MSFVCLFALFSNITMIIAQTFVGLFSGLLIDYAGNITVSHMPTATMHVRSSMDHCSHVSLSVAVAVLVCSFFCAERVLSVRWSDGGLKCRRVVLAPQQAA